MNPAKQLEDAIFFTALNLPDLEQRSAYLDHACAGNPGLRAAVEELLAEQGGAEHFFPRAVPRFTCRWMNFPPSPIISRKQFPLMNKSAPKSAATKFCNGSAKAAAGWCIWRSRRNPSGGGWR
jgi:hypothetical protein